MIEILRGPGPRVDVSECHYCHCIFTYNSKDDVMVNERMNDSEYYDIITGKWINKGDKKVIFELECPACHKRY